MYEKFAQRLAEIEILLEASLENEEYKDNAYSHGFIDGMIKAYGMLIGRSMSYPKVEGRYTDEIDDDDVVICHETAQSGHIVH